MLALSGKNGGLAIDNPIATSEEKFSSSRQITALLANQIMSQDQHLQIDQGALNELTRNVTTTKDEKEQAVVQQLLSSLPSDQQRALKAAQEKETSALVTALPLKKYGFDLSKREFVDFILMRYRWPLPDLPPVCVCGSPFSLDHSQICHLGGFINKRHDTVRDLLANEMSIVLHDVQCEPLSTR